MSNLSFIKKRLVLLSKVIHPVIIGAYILSCLSWYTHAAISAVTANSIIGTAPYFAVDGKKLLNTDELL